jgi:hypothetical protein
MPGASHFVASNDFRSTFDKKPFLYQHNLSQHDLFTNESLYRLAKLAASPESARRKGIVREHMSPGFLVVKGKGKLPWGSPEFHQALDEVFEHLDESNFRLKLSSVNQYDGYRELLEECKQSLSETTGVDFPKAYGHGLATIFIASQNETTPYHIDEEVNFLSQIRGWKQVRLFDGNDRDIVSDKDLEEFWFGHSFIQQRPESACRTFDIGPGMGVYQPPFFPHLITTGPVLSVSLSLPFVRQCDPLAEVYRMNAYMRKYGWAPKPVGSRPGVDRLKSLMIRNALKVKRTFIAA